MTSDIASYIPFLVCRSHQRTCGFPLQHVVETMRALPVEAFGDMKPFMLGISIIRGATVPVINLDVLLHTPDNLDHAADDQFSRYVTVKIGQHVMAFAVGEVIGIGRFSADSVGSLPTLLGEADGGIVKSIGTVDQHLFLVLEASRVISESAWQDLYARGILL